MNHIIIISMLSNFILISLSIGLKYYIPLENNSTMFAIIDYFSTFIIVLSFLFLFVNLIFVRISYIYKKTKNTVLKETQNLNNNEFLNYIESQKDIELELKNFSYFKNLLYFIKNINKEEFYRKNIALFIYKEKFKLNI